MIWICGSFNFYLITFFLKYFPGVVYYNNIAYATADVFAYICSGLVLKYINVRTGLVCAYLIAALSSLMYVIFYKKNISDFAVSAIIFMCRIGGAMSFNMGYVAVAKLFPT
jgi:hypothetical protein